VRYWPLRGYFATSLLTCVLRTLLAALGGYLRRMTHVVMARWS
jgi:hypothetical protein